MTDLPTFTNGGTVLLVVAILVGAVLIAHTYRTSPMCGDCDRRILTDPRYYMPNGEPMLRHLGTGRVLSGLSPIHARCAEIRIALGQPTYDDPHEEHR